MGDRLCQNHIKIWQLCLLSVIAACLILLTVYAVRGIYPFGTANIAYVDDAQYYTPSYYKIWDFFHGRCSMDINWSSGLGEGSSGSWTDLFNPANLVFLFVQRSDILESLSLYLLAYLAMIALAASIAVGKRFPSIGLANGAVLTLLYTFSGFVLQYYSNFGWLFYVMLFPLLLLGLEKLLRDGKWVLYAIVYAIYLLKSIYISYMISIYVVLFSFFYVLFLVDKGRRGDRVLRLGLSTIGAFGISAFCWLRSSVSIAGSSRFESNVKLGVADWMSTLNLSYMRHTLLMLLGMELLAVWLIHVWRLSRRADFPARDGWRKAARFYAWMFGVLLLPMVFLNIDTMWHFGTYNFFPMRYGYMLPATIISAAGLTLEHRKELSDYVPAVAERSSAKKAVLFVCTFLLGAAALLVMSRLVVYWQDYGVCFLNVLSRSETIQYWAFVLGAAALWCALYRFVLQFHGRRAAWLALAVAAVQIGANAYGLIGPDDSASGLPEYNDSYIHESDSLYGYFSTQNLSVLDRAKNVDCSLNAGYPAIAGVSALSSANSSNSSSELEACRLLGYSTNYFLMLDTGGTVLTDMLLGVKFALTQSGLDNSLYTCAATASNTDIGLANYTLRPGLLYTAGSLDGYGRCQNIAERLNCLYGAFTGVRQAASLLTPNVSTDAGTGTCTLSFQAQNAEFVYLAVNGFITHITVNGKAVEVPSYGNLDNATYPTEFNSNLLYLGLYANEPVKITFMPIGNIKPDDITLLALNKASVSSFDADAARADDFTLAEENGRLTMTASAPSANEYLYLPIRASAGWKCTVNGETVKPELVMGLVLGIPLQEGTNTVVVERVQASSAARGWAVTGVTAAAILIYFILRRRECKWAVSAPPALLCRLAGGGFCLIWLGVMLFIYLGPLAMLAVRGTVTF